MKVCALQYDIIWANPQANRDYIEQEISRGHDGVDLFVLPEMFTTGFVMKPHGIAETGNATLEWMRRMAKEHDAAICGSIAVEENGGYHNRLYFVKPSGDYVSYDKKHLFTYSGEDKAYIPGDRNVTVEWRGAKFKLAICYDLRFPCWLRNTAAATYDALILVANWPVKRRMAWDILTRARAIENQCFVIGANRIGTDDMCEYDGGTCVIDPKGFVLHQCPDNAPCSASVELDLADLKSFRDKFPVLADSDL